jgi:hypothetical protein
VVWLPKDLMYKAHEPLVKGGERNLYSLGQEVGLTFSNSVHAFGACRPRGGQVHGGLELPDALSRPVARAGEAAGGAPGSFSSS